MKVLVILSGGLDSTVALARAIDLHAQVNALTFYYGSKHNGRENEAAMEICKHYRIPQHVMNLMFMKQFNSALTTRGEEIPQGHYSAENMSRTVVPGRNAILLSVAAGWAVNIGAQEIWYGAHVGDHPIYPDCRYEFIHAMHKALLLGYGVDLHAPFVEMTKTQIVREGRELHVPIHLTYSCYNGDEEHCGRCGTCVERAEAFALADVPDPTVYTDPEFWKGVCH